MISRTKGIGLALALGLGGVGLLTIRRATASSVKFEWLTGDLSASVCSGSMVAATIGTTPTFARASVGSCKSATGVLVDLTSGQPAIDLDGLLLEPSVENYATRSDEFDNAAWTNFNSTETANDVNGPTGSGTTAERITDDTATDVHSIYRNNLGFACAGNHVASVFVKSGTRTFHELKFGSSQVSSVFSSTTCDVSATNTSLNYGFEPYANGWCRIFGATSDIGLVFMGISMGSTFANAQSGYAGDGTGTFYIARAQAESCPNNTYPTSPIAVAGSAVTRAATTASLANPLTSGAAWCVRARYRPSWDLWDKGNTQGLWLIGAAQGNSNSSDAFVNASGKVVVRTYDSGGGLRTWTSTNSLTDGAHDLRVCSNQGTVTAYDGVESLAGSTAGAGTGIISTMPSGDNTLYWGSHAAANYFTGRVRDACVINSGTGCASSVASSLSVSDLGGGTVSNPFLNDEPVWCTYRASVNFSSSAEVMGSGTAGQANTWVLETTGGSARITIRDYANRTRVRTTTNTFSGSHSLRMCAVRGEAFIDVDGTWQQVTIPNNETGIGKITFQPTSIRGLTTDCFTRDWTGCSGTKPNLMMAFGDSLTEGAGITAWPAYLDADIPSTWVTYNYAVGTKECDDMLTEQWKRQAKGVKWNYVSGQCGINDAINGRTGAAMWADYQAIVADAASHGSVPILIHSSPWKVAEPVWTAGKQTHYNTLRTNQATYCTDNSRTCINLYTAFGDTDPEELSPTYENISGDGIHWNATAQTYAKNQVKTAMGL